eukprot:267322-Pelagomonas_calceolata.AAC.3
MGRFDVPYHHAGGPVNMLLDPKQSTPPDVADSSAANVHQQRSLQTEIHPDIELSGPGHEVDEACQELYLANQAGTSGHDYCTTNGGGGCNNCLEKGNCYSADKKGEDASICRFPKRVGGTVPDCKLCPTGCPGIVNDKVWEIPLHVPREDSDESFTVGKLVIWQEPYRELHATVKLDCPWMMWSTHAPGALHWYQWVRSNVEFLALRGVRHANLDPGLGRSSPCKHKSFYHRGSPSCREWIILVQEGTHPSAVVLAFVLHGGAARVEVYMQKPEGQGPTFQHFPASEKWGV